MYSFQLLKKYWEGIMLFWGSNTNESQVGD